MKTYRLMFVVMMSIACGDDGGGDEPEGTSTGGSGSSTSSSSSSTTNVGTNTTSNSGSEGESSSGTTDGTSGSSGSGTTASSDTDTDTGTDTGGGCGAITDEQACMDAGCAWVGPGGMGNCVEPGDMCKGVMFEMQCNFIPGCQWSEDEMACLPGA